MNSEEFRLNGRKVIDAIANYEERLPTLPVLPDVQPGFLVQQMPTTMPQIGEDFNAIMTDFESIVMPGVTQWHHPNFHAYYPTGKSYASQLGGMLCDAISCIGFTWLSSPSCTELEVLCLDWLVRGMGLPDCFLSTSATGGGVIQGSASEATIVALLTARSRYLKQHFGDTLHLTNGVERNSLIGRMVVYASDQAHCSVAKACEICLLNLHYVDSASDHVMRGDALAAMIERDLQDNLIPLVCVATLGTTSSCKFDDLQSLGITCQFNNVWLHVDAAYAGSGLFCEEYRQWIRGIELTDSFNFNAHKLLYTTFDCSPMWLKDRRAITDAFTHEPHYLRDTVEKKMPDFRNWQLPLGRRFRSLKLWFVLRSFGIEKIKQGIRKHAALAVLFRNLLLSDGRFEIIEKVEFGLVCFRIKNDNTTTQRLLKLLTNEKDIFLVGSYYEREDVYFLRFFANHSAEEKDVRFAVNTIQKAFDRL